MLRGIVLTAALATSVAAPTVHAAFTTFAGGTTAQSAWRNAVGTYVSEDFEGFSVNAPVTSLPTLGLAFDPLSNGAQPGIYRHGVDNTPFESKQLANFPGNCCIASAYRYGDLSARVIAGVDLYAFAFWNGDPQGNSVLSVFDQSDNLLGTVTALINTGTSPTNLSNSFAGFISTVPVGRLFFEGFAGDGWNHYDGLQVSFNGSVPTPASEPSALALAVMSLCVLGIATRARSRVWSLAHGQE